MKLGFKDRTTWRPGDLILAASDEKRPVKVVHDDGKRTLLSMPPNFQRKGESVKTQPIEIIWQVRDKTYNDIQTDVQVAIADSLTSSASWLSSAPAEDAYVCIVDMTDAWVVYQVGWDGCYMQCSYTMDDGGTVSLSDPVEVQRETNYVPVAGRSQRDAPDPDEPYKPGKNPVQSNSNRLPSQVRKGNPLSKIETRAFSLSNVQFRMDEDGVTAHFSGYASTTDQPYGVRDYMGEYNETIRAGAFKKTLREADVPLLFNHDGMPIASTGGGTMRLSEDSAGLKVDADLDRRQSLTNDICIALERGDLKQMSFSFAAVKDDWNADYTERGVSELRLFDASIVTYPANPNTSASLRFDGSRRSAELVAVLDSAEERDTHLVKEATDAAHEQVRTKYIELLVAKEEQERAGKAISAANADSLQDALTALNQVDDLLSTDVATALGRVDAALDEGQKAISDVLGVSDPDGGPNDPDSFGDQKSGSAASAKGANNTGAGSASASSGSAGGSIAPADGAGPRSRVPASVLETRALLKALR